MTLFDCNLYMYQGEECVKGSLCVGIGVGVVSNGCWV